MPKIFTSKTQKIGSMGENIACRFLMKQDFRILDRNYTKKWGEIDIIAEKKDILYFIEVKSITNKYVSCETDTYRPEENMHFWKIKRLLKTIKTYLLSKKIKKGVKWQFDLLIIYLDLKNKKAKIKKIEDIILS